MKFKPKFLIQAFTAINFKDFLWLVICSLFAGHYLVSHQEAEYFWELWMMGSYYPALAGSFLIAFVVCFTVFYIDGCLNLAWSWRQQFYQRLLKQLLFGIVLPVTLLPLLVWTYFSLRGETFDLREYIRVDFGVSVILVLLLNGFYLCRYLLDLLQVYYQPIEDQFLAVEEGQAELKSPDADISEFLTAIYIYHSDRVNWAIQPSGEMIDTGLLMDQLEMLLPKSDFFRVQKGFVVHRQSIQKPMKASSHRLLLYLNTPYHKALPFTELEGSKRNYVVVSQRKVSAFREWFASEV